MANEPLISFFKPGELTVEIEKPVVATEEVTPVAVTPPVVEPPVVEPVVAVTEPTTEPVVEPTAVEVKETIKEVEKIVEKYPEMDEYTGQIFQALIEGKEDVLLTYLSEKHKDYKTMSDYDAVKERLRKDNPAWSSEDLDLKIEVQYGEIAKINLNKIDKEESPEEYEQAVAHNALVERNLKVLKLDGINAREWLDANKKNIQLPKIDKPAEQVIDQPTAEQIAQGRADWEALVVKEVPQSLTKFKWQAGNKEEGYEDVSYKVSDAEKTETLGIMKNLNGSSLALELGWMDKKGKQDLAKIAGDVLLLKKAKHIISSAYSQGKNAGTKGTIVEIKNIDLNNSSSSSVATTALDIGGVSFGHLNPK